MQAGIHCSSSQRTDCRCYVIVHNLLEVKRRYIHGMQSCEFSSEMGLEAVIGYETDEFTELADTIWFWKVADGGLASVERTNTMGRVKVRGTGKVRTSVRVRVRGTVKVRIREG